MYAAVTGHQSSIHRDKPGGAATAKSCTLIYLDSIRIGMAKLVKIAAL
jgi:hypothetical protein